MMIRRVTAFKNCWLREENDKKSIHFDNKKKYEFVLCKSQLTPINNFIPSINISTLSFSTKVVSSLKSISF